MSNAQAQELALVASTTDNAVLILDDRARITWANAGFTRMSGYTLEEVLGRRPGEFLNGPATDPRTLDLIRERIVRGERFEVEIAHYHKSGRVYWAMVDVQPVRDAQGRTVKYISLERDITRTKEVEAALRLSAARLREAQEIALLGSWELDLLADHYYLSEVAQRIYEIHYGDQPVPREVLAVMMDPDDLQRLRASRKAAIAGGETYSCLVRLMLPGQRTKYVQIRGSVHADDGVQINRVVGTLQDVTEQKLAELALQRSEERLREAQQLARVGGFEADLTGPAQRILLSEEAQHIHELYRPDGMVLLSELWARVPQEDQVAYQRERDAAIASGADLSAQHRIVLSDGRVKHLHIRARVVRDDAGRPVRLLGSVQDVTEQKLAEQALRDREAQAQELALVAARTDNAVIISDAEGGITWVNEGFTRMTGYALDEVRGQRAHKLLHGPDTDREVTRVIRDRVARGESVEVEILHYRKDGQKQWVAIDVQPVRDDDGRLVKFISIERDITQGKLAEQALRESEARLREAQRLARIGHWELDLARDEYIMSDEALRIHEVEGTDGRVPRTRIDELVHPQDRDLLREQRGTTTHETPDFDIVLRLMLAEARTKYVQLRVRVQADATGQPLRVSGTIQDVTEQKLAEQALRELNETLEQRVQERTNEAHHQRNFIESILATAESLIFVVDHRGRVVRFNRACERLTGYTFDELQGKPFWEFVVTPERRDEMRRQHEDQRDPSRLAAHLEVEWLTKDGRRRLLSWNNGMITDAQGRLEYMIGTGIDITERKRDEQALIVANENLNRSIENLRQTQDQLVQSEKLASLGALVAGISHEINTPLGIGVTSATSLQEELELLQRDFQAGTMRRSTLERFISHGLEGSAILVRNLMRAADLIRSFKQVAVDQASDEEREIDLGHYIDEVVLSLQPKFKGRPIQVVNASQPQLRLLTRPGAIYQILSNLVINALVHGYAPDQAGIIRIEARREGGDVVIDFADDGRGIPPEHRHRIFDPFFTTRRGSGGSGLGLHIVFNLVTSNLKGSIRLVENADQGAAFRIVFPSSAEQQHEQA